MRLEYFPEASIYGIDVSKSYEGSRYRTFLADQSDMNALREIANSGMKHPVFRVVDDGSHLPEFQILSFNFLLSEGIQIWSDVVRLAHRLPGGMLAFRGNKASCS